MFFPCAIPRNSLVSACLSRAEVKPEADPAADSGGGGLAPGVIAGIVICAVVGVVVAVGLVLVAHFKHGKEKNNGIEM